MAMSRSLGGTKVTSRSPISTRPPSSGSSPASMRRAVVLPDPDGPTSTMNSPSLMSRSSPSTAGGVSLVNTRDADTYFTPAIGSLRRVRGRIHGARHPAWWGIAPQGGIGSAGLGRSLDCSHRQAADQRALRYPAHDDHRYRGDRCRRAQVGDEQPFLRD